MSLETARSRRVLLVEDNPDDQDLARIANGRLARPFCLEIADDGQDALDRLRAAVTPTGGAASRVPDLLLVDLSMPRMDGLSFLRKLRSEPGVSRLPVLIFTTSTASKDVTNCYEAGCNSYIVKPMDISELTSLFDIIDAYWFNCVKQPDWRSGSTNPQW